MHDRLDDRAPDPRRRRGRCTQQGQVRRIGRRGLHHLSDAFFVGAEYALSVLFFASAILALRYAVLPRWLGWVSIVIGVVLLIGPIGWAAFIFATPIWTILVRILLWRHAEASARFGEPAIGTTA
jgi:hypothetical protein